MFMPLRRQNRFTGILCSHSGIICAIVCRCSASSEQLKKSAFFVRPGCGPVMRPMWSRASWHKSCVLCTKVQKTDQNLSDGWGEKSEFAQIQELCIMYIKMLCVKNGIVKNYFSTIPFLLFSICFIVSSLLRFCSGVSFFFLTYLSVDVPTILSSPHWFSDFSFWNLLSSHQYLVHPVSSRLWSPVSVPICRTWP